MYSDQAQTHAWEVEAIEVKKVCLEVLDGVLMEKIGSEARMDYLKKDFMSIAAKGKSLPDTTIVVMGDTGAGTTCSTPSFFLVLTASR